MAATGVDRASAEIISDQPGPARWVGVVVGALLFAGGAPMPLLPLADLGIRTAAAEAAGNDFADVVARVKPAVVGVRAIVTLPMDEQPASLPLSPKGFGLPKEKKPGELPHPRAATSQGSGFFVSADGYIVTTNHVIENSHHIEITTDDDKTYPARIAGRDPKTDLALLKVDTGNAFPFVGFAHHAPQVGESVIAIGYPFGLGGTVTAGIVSARARDIKMGAYNEFLQIDAPVNRGNSGGPSFDRRGDVIGVNSAIFSPSGGSIGIGFAIPADTVEGVVQALKERGAVVRGWIGVAIQPLTDEIAEGLDAKGRRGALVVDAQAGDPAAKAGIGSGDIITAIDGKTVKDDRDLTAIVSAMVPGAVAQVTVIRRGEEKMLPITLGVTPGAAEDAVAQAPMPVAASNDPANLGLTLAPGDRLSGGVVVTDVDPGGTGAARGFAVGDVILEVAREAVRTPKDVQNALSGARNRGARFAVARVKSGDTQSFIAIPLG